LPVLSAPDAGGVLTSLRSAGVQVLATTVDGEVSLDSSELEADLPNATAWLFGPESHGLPPQLAERADRRVHIPMRGSAESLNIASAASICLYQSARAQRD
jgi:TrmH family RNA methyltransferase